jgi:hypothetical protein
VQTAAHHKNLRTTENAVKTKIGPAVASYVLIADAKMALQMNASSYTFLKILWVSISKKTDFMDLAIQ